MTGKPPLPALPPQKAEPPAGCGPVKSGKAGPPGNTPELGGPTDGSTSSRCSQPINPQAATIARVSQSLNVRDITPSSGAMSSLDDYFFSRLKTLVSKR